MRFVNQEIGLSVEISDQLIERIREVGLVHYPNEFGGVLIGMYSSDKRLVYISDMIIPKSYSSTRYTFDRGAEGLKEELGALFQAKPSRIYVGEWHTHPNALPFPSGTDIQALRQIVDSETVNINNPVMLIVGLNRANMSLGLYVYFNAEVLSYELVTESVKIASKIKKYLL